MVAVRGFERPARKDFCSPFVVEGAAMGMMKVTFRVWNT